MAKAKRRAAKIDENQPGIVDALRKIPGCEVITDMDDILVGFRGVNYWFEIKDPEKTRNQDGSWRHGAIKPGQMDLARSWPGQYHIVCSIDEILKIMGVQ